MLFRSPTTARPSTRACRCSIAVECSPACSRWCPTPGRTRWITIRAMPTWCGRGPTPAPRAITPPAVPAYATPSRPSGWGGWLGGWAIDSQVRVRSGFPTTVLLNEQYQGISLANAFRPDRILNQPVWLDEASAPGGKRLNQAAFQAAPAGTQGTLGRNSIPGFGMGQVDLALRREFRVRDSKVIQGRSEER